MELSGVVDDRFEIDRLAGEGGMGAVYRAWDRQGGVVVALKVLHGDSDEHVARFARESRLLSQLNHPGIVRFVAEGTLPDGDAYLVMEWLAGESLQERLDRSLMTVGETVTMAAAAAAALGTAHERGVTHRDLKPGNIFLVDGAVSRVKVLDFGIARVTDTARALTATEQMLGTPGYMSPEQMRASRHASPATDVYALGCVIFKALTGRTPFVGTSALDVILQAASGTAPLLSTVRSDAPPELVALVAQMLTGDPHARPANGRIAAQALEAVQAARQAAGAQSWRPPEVAGAATVEQTPATDVAPAPPAEISAMGTDPAVRTGLYAGPGQHQPGTNTPIVAPYGVAPPGPRGTPRHLAPILLGLGGLVALGLMALATWWYVEGSKPSRAPPREQPWAGAPTGTGPGRASTKRGAFSCSNEHCEYVAYPDPKQVPIDDLYARAQRVVRRLEPRAELLTIVAGSYKGRGLDMTHSRCMAAFEFTAAANQLVSATFVLNVLVIRREPQRGDRPGPKPGCSTEAVWRAAVVAGFELTEAVTLNYANRDWGGPGLRPLWSVLQPGSRWALFDAQTCQLVMSTGGDGGTAKSPPAPARPGQPRKPKGFDPFTHR
ncbi:MAG: serine/threonine protein kinase [Deltaproteobacteria bacterium]|nr:serine/threonine protein kinase [Deltaproteobacteria bacterium]